MNSITHVILLALFAVTSAAFSQDVERPRAEPDTFLRASAVEAPVAGKQQAQAQRPLQPVVKQLPRPKGNFPACNGCQDWGSYHRMSARLPMETALRQATNDGPMR